ncbi:MAG: LytTR family DNA-binding domain-containing protein [Saprospiraceae bacterium]|nr:LytTR family DNA-binding domain-containing protein [Saprospiraceae bacterium]
MKTILVDDEENSLDILEIELKEYCPQVEIVAKCKSGREAIAAVHEFNPDVVFLDIEMPQMNGFEVLKNLEDQEFDVIFVTAYDQFALKAFEFSAVDYLLKPIVKERLIAAVEKVSSLAETSISAEQLNMLMTNFQSYWQSQPRVALPTSEGLEFVSVDQIIYAQSESNYCWIFFEDGSKIFLSKTLKDLEGLLAKHGFIRIHQSYLINTDFIKRYVRGQGGYIILSNGAKVPVSRSKKEVILNLGRW